jgi:hypothetical protein
VRSATLEDLGESIGAARADADGRSALGESFRESRADASRRACHQHVLAAQ